MGLDISFNKHAAVMAGLVVQMATNGTAENIAATKLECLDLSDTRAADYLVSLQEVHWVMKVPSADYRVGIDEFSVREPDGSKTVYFYVRANRWGTTFAPLTEWLNANGIEWHES